MKNLCYIFRLGVLSYAMVLLISCEPEDVATSSYPAKESIQNTDYLAAKKLNHTI